MTATIADHIKYAAAHADSVSEWALSEIGDCENDHDIVVNTLSDSLAKLLLTVHQIPDRHRYSDGRAIVARAEIVPGYITQHIWKPEDEEPTSWRSDLPSGDPDLPSPGKYEVTTDPVAQELHVRVLASASPTTPEEN